ncbi:peptidase S8 and S53 subtilisin kexin sedolisin [Meiothermus ruber H328]|nr:peptidase S8 and S53 subtilisin kexin sedolisin [Meiothermus ruber H328]
MELDGPALPKGQAKAELMRLLKTHLGQAEGRLRIKASKGFWASQSLLVRLPASEVKRLAQVPGVRRVYPNRTVQLGQPVARALSGGGGAVAAAGPWPTSAHPACGLRECEARASASAIWTPASMPHTPIYEAKSWLLPK